MLVFPPPQDKRSECSWTFCPGTKPCICLNIAAWFSRAVAVSECQGRSHTVPECYLTLLRSTFVSSFLMTCEHCKDHGKCRVEFIKPRCLLEEASGHEMHLVGWILNPYFLIHGHYMPRHIIFHGFFIHTVDSIPLWTRPLGIEVNAFHTDNYWNLLPATDWSN